ncbi:hypothetical protein E1B28_001162 [Marasmius oreades]|uniref:FMR1-interacting protein 1 conserved domain-containing protein n=1 Tax=Marasmius oreades TaxID=181124 RepID=A0A9P7V2Y6_9AGAR|nr:uncharacterized protein E1B28_001162 [Marasmius oreades]KAG7099304.1 hypothetical protein E1B28_001162 [Marasmius oreades]
MHGSHHHQRQPKASTSSNQAWSLAQQSSLVASTGRSALNNPYASTYSSHYTQTYSRYSTSVPYTNPEGFTYSSTYNPALSYSNASANIYTPPSAPSSHLSPTRSFPLSSNSSWYQAGSSRCTYKQCTFTGSAKSVEIHMADRHLIYPPNWEKLDKKSNWDADPSLKGKVIPIQGTNITLETHEAIDNWVAERKKRWPTSTLIQEKKRKLEDAAARGELSVEELGLFGKKRKFQGDGDLSRGRTKRGRARGPDLGEHATITKVVPRHPLPKKPVTEACPSGGESSDDGAPESMPVRPPPDELPNSPVTPAMAAPVEQLKDTRSTANGTGSLKKRSIQPKDAPHIPFGPKSNLLRNLLLPEIRITVSNLSQAIRFIVDNDFFNGVELKPGEANEKKIEVIEAKDQPDPSHSKGRN